MIEGTRWMKYLCREEELFYGSMKQESQDNKSRTWCRGAWQQKQLKIEWEKFWQLIGRKKYKDDENDRW